MRKVLLTILLSILVSIAAYAKKQNKPVIIMSSYDPTVVEAYNNTITSHNIFAVNSRIYFTIYNPKGFKSDYIKYQIIKQDDNAHIGGYTRIRNLTKKVNDKYSYTDYFVLASKGKYYIQVFDITNLHQWLAIDEFRVIDD